VFGSSQEAQRLLARTEAVERACAEQAELVWACSEEDRTELVDRYALDRDKVLVVPNGLALEETPYTAPVDRAERKRRLRLEDRFTALFIASWHEPNLAGARELIRVAARLPEIELMIVGSVGLAFGGHSLPANVQITGPVSAEFKRTILGIADVALNPVRTGSGTNLKMLDYLGSGIPVISTAFGARGLGLTPGEHYLEAEPGGFALALRRFRELDLTERDALTRPAHDHVEQRLSWTTIISELLAGLVSARRPTAASGSVPQRH
jgi:glycosyltransferase involved in cell wall biosynthesis